MFFSINNHRIIPGENMADLMEATTVNFEEEVILSAGKVLVDFWAPWCGSCKMQTPILEKLAADSDVNAKICKINADENGDIAKKYSIVSMPTLILFENGKEIERFVSVQPESILKKKLG